MSVLIKGMKIPYCCTECSYCEEHEHKEILRNDDYEYKVKMIFNCKLKPEDVEDGWVGAEVADRKRQDWCPLVDVPAADVVPVAFKGFAEWVADWVLRSDFEESAGGFAELACRRLEALGIMRKDGNVWVRNEVEE